MMMFECMNVLVRVGLRDSVATGFPRGKRPEFPTRNSDWDNKVKKSNQIKSNVIVFVLFISWISREYLETFFSLTAQQNGYVMLNGLVCYHPLKYNHAEQCTDFFFNIVTLLILLSRTLLPCCSVRNQCCIISYRIILPLTGYPVRSGQLLNMSGSTKSRAIQSADTHLNSKDRDLQRSCFNITVNSSST